MNFEKERLKIEQKYDPFIATGADLDYLGKLCGLVREGNNFWCFSKKEADAAFRVRILKRFDDICKREDIE